MKTSCKETRRIDGDHLNVVRGKWFRFSSLSRPRRSFLRPNFSQACKSLVSVGTATRPRRPFFQTQITRAAPSAATPSNKNSLDDTWHQPQFSLCIVFFFFLNVQRAVQTAHYFFITISRLHPAFLPRNTDHLHNQMTLALTRCLFSLHSQDPLKKYWRGVFSSTLTHYNNFTQMSLQCLSSL